MAPGPVGGDSIVCASCGARMRAGRERCLRCDAPLVAAPEPPAPGTPRERALVTATVVSLFLLIAATLVWEARTPPLDQHARPVAGAATRPPAGTTTQPAASPPPSTASAATGRDVEPLVPVTAVESKRIGDAAFGAGDFDRARAEYEQAVRQAPGNAEALNNLGQVLARQQRTAEAIDLFTRATRIAPDKWAYHFNLAHAYGEQAQWDAAVAEYRIAARLFPDDYAVQYNLAMALHRKGDDETAAGEFKKAIELAPGEPSFHLALAITLEKLNRKQDARAEYVRYLEMAPEVPDAARVKARIETLSRAAGNGSRQAP